MKKRKTILLQKIVALAAILIVCISFIRIMPDAKLDNELAVEQATNSETVQEEIDEYNQYNGFIVAAKTICGLTAIGIAIPLIINIISLKEND